MKKYFNYKEIKKENIFIGNILMITDLNKETLDYIKEQYPKLFYYHQCCESSLAKENAILIKVGHDKYVDLDFIKEVKDCELINYYLDNNIKSNIVLEIGSPNPYLGELYVDYLTLSNCDIKEESINILELKNKQK